MGNAGADGIKGTYSPLLVLCSRGQRGGETRNMSLLRSVGRVSSCVTPGGGGEWEVSGCRVDGV